MPFGISIALVVLVNLSRLVCTGDRLTRLKNPPDSLFTQAGSVKGIALPLRKRRQGIAASRSRTLLTRNECRTKSPITEPNQTSLANSRHRSRADLCLRHRAHEVGSRLVD